MYLTATKPFRKLLLFVIILFYLSFRARSYTAIALIFPVSWLIVKYARAASRLKRRVIFLLPAAVVLAGLIIPALIHPEKLYFGWGGWFVEVARHDGLVKAFSHNMLLHLSYLLPWLFAVSAIFFTGRVNQALWKNDASAAAFLGSGSLFLMIYAIELTTPLTGFGIREFLSLAGTFGGLFFLPMLIMLIFHLWGRIYCFVIFSAFLTLPALVIQRGPRSLDRFRDTLADDRGAYVMRVSPYLDAGERIFHSPHWRKLSRKEALKFHLAGCEILEQGVEDAGYYQSFAPISLYHAVLFRYGIGDREKSTSNLERLLRRWPRTSLYLLGESWPTSSPDPGLEGFDWLASSVRTHQYWQSQILPEADRILAALAWKTKDSLYEAIRKNLINRKGKDRKVLTSAQVRAAVFTLSDLEP